ncbi:MAG: Rab family GTPase [Thermoplasmata archaeon]
MEMGKNSRNSKDEIEGDDETITTAQLDVTTSSRVSDEIVLVKKICMVGDPAVGKTSLINQFVYKMFSDRYMATIGANITKKPITLKLGSGHTFRIKLMIWDIAGQKTYDWIKPTYYKNAEGALVVCDLTRDITIENTTNWIKNLTDVAGPIPFLIIGNKLDIATAGKKEMVSKTADKYKVKHFFTSAATGENVEEAFLKLGEDLATHFLRTKGNK